MKHLKLAVTTLGLLLGTSAFAAGTTETTTDTTTDTYTSDSLETTSGTRSTSPNAMDQSTGTAADVETTRTIREGLSNDSKLSTSAKNVEVVTLGNTITLKGSVSTQAEKDQVFNHAKAAAGSKAIRNEITVR